MRFSNLPSAERIVSPLVTAPPVALLKPVNVAASAAAAARALV